MTATPTDAINPVAYLHNVAFGDEETDQALSFKAESFPLEGVAGYRKVSCEPLILQSAHDKALADMEVYYKHLLRAANEDRARLEGEAAQARGTSQFWKDNHLAGNQRIEELEAALAAANARADADARRLDWMDANGFTAYRQIDPVDGLSRHCVVVHEAQDRRLPRRGNVADTIRDAIDDAMPLPPAAKGETP